MPCSLPLNHKRQQHYQVQRAQYVTIRTHTQLYRLVVVIVVNAHPLHDDQPLHGNCQSVRWWDILYCYSRFSPALRYSLYNSVAAMELCPEELISLTEQRLSTNIPEHTLNATPQNNCSRSRSWIAHTPECLIWL